MIMRVSLFSQISRYVSHRTLSQDMSYVTSLHSVYPDTTPLTQVARRCALSWVWGDIRHIPRSRVISYTYRKGRFYWNAPVNNFAVEF